METIGQKIGIVGHSFNITNDAGDKASLNIKVSFASCSDAEIKGWLASNRTIAGQTAWRKLTLSELNELNGRTFNATTIGHKVESRQKMIDMYVDAFRKAGLDDEQSLELATKAVDNPA